MPCHVPNLNQSLKDLALRLSGGLERLSGGSGWRGYLYSLTLPSPPTRRPESRLAAHARPGPAGDSDIPACGGLEQLTHAAGGYLHTFIPYGRRQPNRGSRLTPGQVTAGAQVRRASARITNGFQRCCAASGPSSLPSLTGPRVRAAHKCRDCWSLASGPLSSCPP